MFITLVFPFSIDYKREDSISMCNCFRMILTEWMSLEDRCYMEMGAIDGLISHSI